MIRPPLLPTRRQWSKWSLPSKLTALGALVGVLGLLAWFSTPISDVVRRLRTSALEFSVVSRPVDLPTPTEGALAVGMLRNRRLYLLQITNPNHFPITALRMDIQWPEAILSVRPEKPSAHYSVVANAAWDSHPLYLIGEVPPSTVVEPFAEEEKTGLWMITVSSIPAFDTVTLELLATTGLEGGLYTKEAPEVEPMRSPDELLWLIEGSYKYEMASETATQTLLFAIDFDRDRRDVIALRAASEKLGGTRLRLLQGRGARVPGLFKTWGYFVAKGRKGTSYTAPVQLETTRNIDVMFGLFGPSRMPGFMIKARTTPRK